jgi:hypothetical protein
VIPGVCGFQQLSISYDGSKGPIGLLRTFIHRNEEKLMMRSELVFEAVTTLRNRYMLCQLASKATRKFHKPNTRIQDTTNEVLHRIADSERQEVILEPETASEAQRRAA